ncbi:MAG: beta galactosidase jelly roll domain-containing protein [Saprospiraceae bacterium]|nr:beta galactosidase jelly roll domain-containing protein [Saprospiraceae bacterium]
MRFLSGLVLGCLCQYAVAQNLHLHNVTNRPATLLAGNWHYIVDPYETGFRNHRNWTPYDEKEAATTSSAAPYYTNRKQVNRWDRIEYDFDQSPTLNVPGDWNHQRPELLYYEGSIWYKTDFKYNLPAGRRLLLHFGAANYRADVYLNGKKAGMHEGGYDPFHFDVTQLVQAGDNFLVVRVDNRRERDRVPGMTTDWWNYGGITRDVSLLEVPQTFISNFFLQADKAKRGRATGWVQLDGPQLSQKITVSIPALSVSQTVATDAKGRASLDLDISASKRWYPERPQLYEVVFKAETDQTSDRIGFRTIETKGKDLILNGKPIFLRGICMHEEVPTRMARAFSREDAQLLLGWAKELNCNFVRLAHYPHNEHTVRLADEIGLLVWDEVPVYWGINYENSATYAQAESQIRAMVERDKNRASVIVWSVANETPREDPQRLVFLNNMAAAVRQIDNTRLLSAALDRTEDKATNHIRITDPFAATSDVVSTNEYLGWYGSTPDHCRVVTWNLAEHDKPFLVSEFGADALFNHRGDSLTIWTEDYQEWLYREQIEMLKKIPSWRGVTPWILADFRAPRRNLPGIQDGWNRKGLISNNGYKKRAWYVLKAFYDELEQQWAYEIED